MKSYDPNAICPKCGHDDIATGYRRSGYDCPYPRVCGLSQFDGEHHDRTCRRCQYGWPEAVTAHAPSAAAAAAAGDDGLEGGRG